MNIFKKVAAAVTAVAVLAGISVPVSAADSTLKLLTEEVDSEFDSLSVDGLFCVLNDDEYIDEFVSIPHSALKKWRSSGDLKMTDVEVDGNISWNRLNYFSDLPELCNVDSSNSITKRYAYTFDGKDTMKIVKSTTDWIWPATSGSIIYDTTCDRNGNLTFSGRNSAGKNVTAKFKVGENPYSGGYWYLAYGVDSDDYLSYVVYQTTDEPSAKGWSVEVTFAIDLVDKNGKVKNVWKKRATDLTCYSGGTGNYFVFSYTNDVEKTCVYDLKKGKLVTYSSNDLISSKGSSFMKSNGKTVNSTEIYDLDCFQGTRYDVAIAVYQPREGSKNKTTAYRLVDLSSKKGSRISDDYKEMSTSDGKMFLVKTYDDKWGYINAKGKFLGAFDDAGDFKGNYAPVIKNGKAYLVDKTMKCVSEKINATSVRTLGDGLYYVENGNKKYLVTYASGTSSATPTTPTTTKPSASGKDISGLEYYKLANEEYTGGKICPDPSIYDGNYLLEEKTDYTLSYKNNTALGTGTVIVKGCGKYSGTKTLKFNIVLNKPTFSAKKNGSSKAVLSWKKVAGAAGYEIYYAAGNGSFKKLASVSASTLSKSVSGLDIRNNSYKFRIRAYATSSDGKKVFSSWSKTVKIG